MLQNNKYEELQLLNMYKKYVRVLKCDNGIEKQI
jgi:hypothetical protein